MVTVRHTWAITVNNIEGLSSLSRIKAIAIVVNRLLVTISIESIVITLEVIMRVVTTSKATTLLVTTTITNKLLITTTTTVITIIMNVHLSISP